MVASTISTTMVIWPQSIFVADTAGFPIVSALAHEGKRVASGLQYRAASNRVHARRGVELLKLVIVKSPAHACARTPIRCHCRHPWRCRRHGGRDTSQAS